MSFTINGKLIKKLPTQEGESQHGHWIRGGFVIETDEEYSKKIAFSLFGEERVNSLTSIAEGSPVQVVFSPESREYNEKWYTDCKATKIVLLAQAQSQQPQYQQPPLGYPYAGATVPTTPAAQVGQVPYPNAGIAPAQPQQALMSPDDDLPF